MAHYTQEDEPPGRDEFIRENAVVLVAQRDAKIIRLRKKVTELEASRRGLRREIARLQGIIEGLADRVAAQAELLTRAALRAEIMESEGE